MKTLKIALLTTAVLFPLHLTAYAADSCSKEPVTVGLLPKLDTDPYFKAAKTGADAAQKEIGGTVIQVAPSQGTAEAQVNFINSLVAKKVGVIAISANDANAVAPALKRARANGVKVISYDSDVQTAARSLFINQADSHSLAHMMLQSAHDLMGGEGVERAGLDRRFDGIAENWLRLAGREFLLGCFTFPYQHTVLRIPLFVALPGFLAGSIALGGLMQIAMAFSNVVTTLSWFIFSYKPLSNLVAASSRLDGFLAATSAVRQRSSGIVAESAGDGLHIRDLKLRAPEGRELMAIGRLDIRPGETVWLRGRSGLGKTTLLKAMAGGWDHGEGSIRMPGARKLFLSQKTYFPQDDIFGAVAYPAAAADFAREDIRDAIEAVGLGDSEMLRLGDQVDGHPLVLSGLSGGEMQRLALARALVLKPGWLFLDEATSALDEPAEAGLLAMLRQRLPTTTFVVISHRDPAATGARRVIDLEAKACPAIAMPELQHA